MSDKVKNEPTDTSTAEVSDPLTGEIRALRQEIARLNNHRFVRIQNSPPRWMLQALVRGLMIGLGTVVGATLLLSVLIWVLSQIEVVPIIGQLAKDIISIVEDGR